jgi:hypothetical protein
MPEFDNPGHTRAIGLDPYFRDIVRCFNSTSYSYNVPGAYKIKTGPPPGVLDPSMAKTYDLLDGIFKTFNSNF